MDKIYKIILLLVMSAAFLSAQPEGMIYEDYVYNENIKSVQFFALGSELALPLVEFNSNQELLLVFDEIDGEGDRYNYTLIHCDQNWTRSDLDPIEYIDGFTDDTIDEYEYSDRTAVDYVNYELLLPNEDMIWTKPGNYLLVIYNDDDELLLTRRFVVVDPILSVNLRDMRPSDAAKVRTYQEFDLEMSNDAVRLSNPKKFIKATILQNGRWDNAITDIPPAYVLGNRIVYDYQDEIIFRGGKEFRLFDTRSLRFPGTGVKEVLRPEGLPYEAILFPDFIRDDEAYVQRDDFNGGFYIINDDSANSKSGTNAEYVEVFFTLKTGTPFYDSEVYILGKFNDWRSDASSKMVYNDAVNGYVAKMLLKQGVYNYAYARIPGDKEKVNRDDIFKTIEGDSYQTENSYIFLFYYRPLGGRFDQLIGYKVY